MRQTQEPQQPKNYNTEKIDDKDHRLFESVLSLTLDFHELTQQWKNVKCVLSKKRSSSRRRRHVAWTSFLERARGASKQVLIAVVVTSILRRAKTETPLVFVDDPASFAEKLEEISISIMIRWRKVSVSTNSSAFESQKILCSFLFKFQLWQKNCICCCCRCESFCQMSRKSPSIDPNQRCSSRLKVLPQKKSDPSQLESIQWS